MGLEKAIIYGKEKRKPYRNSKAFDYSCRNHGCCPWCQGNRAYQKVKELLRMNYEEILITLSETSEPAISENARI